MKNKILLFFLHIFIVFFLCSCGTPNTVKPTSNISINEFSYNSNSYLRQNMYHSVAPGETLWRIAKMYDVDIEKIKRINSIRNEKDLDIGKKLYIPNAAPRKHIISLVPTNKWKYLIIHHSATGHGNSMEFNEAHLKRGWQGIGYHFIIDNGTCGKDDGQIETSPRWIKQMNGAHCKANGMNEKGIGICLVGNFSQTNVSSKQLQSLVYLVNKLRKYYKIPISRILGHGQVPGANTECPGKYFPWKKFYYYLQKS